MTFDEFRDTLAASSPPAALSLPLVALWHDARGDWDAAHTVAQDVNDEAGAWVHAYLHRKEGDPTNAAYWYRRAARPVERGDLADEWARIVRELLTAS